MANNFSNDLERMQQLMKYGLNESSKKNSQSIVEYHQTAADGKTYGIVKECNKFYIKVAPKKDTEVLAEDYDYIGGYMNKKQYEYPTYTIASKQFDLKMKSINEAAGKDKAVLTEQFKPAETAEWQVNETREMRAELERFRQISNNVDYILSENKSEKALQLGDPRSVTDEGGDPYTQKPDSTEKVNNMKETTTDPKKADTTYKEKGEYKEEIKGNEHTDPKTADDTYSKKVGEVESEGKSVATEKGASHKNDKGVKMNEGKRVVKITEEQVLAWSKSLDYMDTSKGTEIGDTAPYTEKLSNEESNQEMNEEAIAMGGDSMDQHTAEVGDTAPFDKNTGKEDLKEKTVQGPDGLPTDDNSTMLTDEFEGATKVNEEKLDVFGKHPAYQKVPFETPANTEIDKWGRDWNDDSTKGEKPFGTQIGHSGDPFSEKVVDMLTDAVLSRLKKKVN